jgi:hypothetical protein
VPSDEVMGEGSWVDLSYLTNDEVDVALKSKLTDNELLEGHVINWNWVKSDGTPMDNPQEHPEALGKLFSPERQFLMSKLFNPDPVKRKNS